MNLFQTASLHIGVAEIEGTNHNDQIIEYAHFAGFAWISDDETPWCSVFLNYVCVKAGFERSGKVNARSWLTVGQATTKPEPGDVVVFWREKIDSWKGHVGLFVGFDIAGERIYVLGGNQKNSVNITAYPADRLLGFRRLKKLTELDFGLKNIRRGDVGSEVRKLQTALNVLGFPCGTVDGFFGPKTEAAVKAFQSTDIELEITGIANKRTKEAIENLYNQHH